MTFSTVVSRFPERDAAYIGKTLSSTATGAVAAMRRLREPGPIMNRTQRRVANKQAASSAAVDQAAALFERALGHERGGDFQAAASLYKKVLSADPQHAMACDRLAALYLAQGKRDKASAQYAELVRIAPQTLNQFDIVLATLKKLQPAFAVGLLAHS